MVCIMSILQQKEKSSSYLSFQTDLTADSQDYSEIISFIERIRNYQLPDTQVSKSYSLSLRSLRNDTLANSLN